MNTAEQVLEVERAATNAATFTAATVAFWATVAARSRDSPAMQGQALGFAFLFAHGLIDRGAEPRDVRHLLAVATITRGAP